ncbi:hypothetical protein Trydic_g3994 [Trypoxylus dichotomus]
MNRIEIHTHKQTVEPIDGLVFEGLLREVHERISVFQHKVQVKLSQRSQNLNPYLPGFMEYIAKKDIFLCLRVAHQCHTPFCITYTTYLQIGIP